MPQHKTAPSAFHAVALPHRPSQNNDRVFQFRPSLVQNAIYIAVEAAPSLFRQSLGLFQRLRRSQISPVIDHMQGVVFRDGDRTVIGPRLQPQAFQRTDHALVMGGDAFLTRACSQALPDLAGETGFAGTRFSSPSKPW